MAETAAELAVRGHVCLMRGDRAGAIEAYSRAIVADPADPAVYISRASVQAHVGRTALALADLDAAVRLDPGSADARHARAGVHLSRWDFAAARADADAAISLAPERWEFYLTRGLARYHQRDRTADADYAAAFRLAPAQVARRVVDLAARGDTNAALKDCENHLRADPSEPTSLARRGLILLLLGRESEAERDFAAYRRENSAGTERLDGYIAEARHRRAGRPLCD